MLPAVCAACSANALLFFASYLILSCPLICFAASIRPPVTVRVGECLSIRPLRPDGFRLSLACDRGKLAKASCASTTHLAQPPQLANSCFKVVSSTVSCHPVLTPWDGVSALSDVKHAINFESRLGLCLFTSLRVGSHTHNRSTAPPLVSDRTSIGRIKLGGSGNPLGKGIALSEQSLT
jgi:hypothetical protein